MYRLICTQMQCIGVSCFLPIPLASNGGVTVLIVLPVHKLQYVNCHMLPQVFNLGMEWRYKTKIKYPTKLLAEVKVLSFLLHYPVEDH